MAVGAAELERVARAIEALCGDPDALAFVDLDAVASDLGWSRSRFDRVFREAVGLSPDRFLGAATLDLARRRLRSASVLETAGDLGLSSPSRLHDLCVTFEGATPGDWRRRGAELTIRWTMGPTAFGPALLARTARGICALFFGTREECTEDLAARFPEAELIEDDRALRPDLARIFDLDADRTRPFHLDLRGTALQLAVWEALLTLPPGDVTSYTEIARLAGRPDATRAVASAIGRNPVSYLIPCHRVLRRTGELGGYRWGLTRKRALLAVETGGQVGA